MTSALRGKGAGSKADGDSADRLRERDSDKKEVICTSSM